MIPVRILAVLVSALVLQVGVLSWFPVGGYVPDLLFVAVAVIASLGSAEDGALLGFGAGILADLTAYSTPFGMWTFVGCVMGAVAGAVVTERVLTGVVARSLVVGALVASASSLFVVFGLLIGESHLRDIDVGGAILFVGIVAAALAPVGFAVAKWALLLHRLPWEIGAR